MTPRAKAFLTRLVSHSLQGELVQGGSGVCLHSIHMHPAIFVLLPCLLDACLGPQPRFCMCQVHLCDSYLPGCKPLLEAGCSSIRQVQVQLRQFSETLLLSPIPPVQKKSLEPIHCGASRPRLSKLLFLRRGVIWVTKGVHTQTFPNWL